MKRTNETHEFVYSVNPDGNVEHIVLQGIELDWNDADIHKVTDEVINKKPKPKSKLTKKTRTDYIVNLI